VLQATVVDDRGASNLASVAITVTNTPPSVGFVTPTNNARYIEGDGIGVTVTASDGDGGVTNVTLLVGTNVVAGWASGPYVWNWSNVVAGSYVLEARATDSDGAMRTATVSVLVVTNAYPVVTIQSPTNGASYAAPVNLAVQVTASDADGSVTNLQVVADGTART